MKYFTNILIERLKPDTISSKTKWDIKLNLALDKWVKINNKPSNYLMTLYCEVSNKYQNSVYQ